MSRSDLAEKLGVSPAFVTKLMRGQNNFTLRTMVKVAQAIGCELTVNLVEASSPVQSQQTNNGSILSFLSPPPVETPQTTLEIVSNLADAPRITYSVKIDNPPADADLALAA